MNSTEEKTQAQRIRRPPLGPPPNMVGEIEKPSPKVYRARPMRGPAKSSVQGKISKFFISIKTKLKSFKNIYFQVKIEPDEDRILRKARDVLYVYKSSKPQSVESASPCKHPSPGESEEGARGSLNNYGMS